MAAFYFDFTWFKLKGAKILHDLSSGAKNLHDLTRFEFWDNFEKKSNLYIDKKAKKCYNFYKIIEKCGWGVFMTYKAAVKKLRLKMLMTQEEFAKLID